MNTELLKNKGVLAVLAALVVGLGVYTGYIDISFLTGLFGGTTPTAQ